MESTLENAKLQGRVVSWEWLETCRATSSGASDQHKVRVGFYPEGWAARERFTVGPCVRKFQGHGDKVGQEGEPGRWDSRLEAIMLVTFLRLTL